MRALLAICAIYGVYGELVGPVMIRENGVNVTRYVVSTDASYASTSGSSIMVKHDGQVQIAANGSATYSPYMFMEYKLSGKTLSYTTDLSSVGCSCNSALYLVTMPGYGSNGQPNPGKGGDYYCDANDVNGEWCWEIDVQEANKYVTAATPHQCYQKPGGYISSCDRGGCGTNSHNVDGNSIGPGSQFKIDTTKPFRYSINFGSTYHVKLSQGSSTFEMDACNNGGYIQSVNQALDYGMVIVMSYWGSSYSTMQWLDGNTGCQGDCAGSGVATFSDIEIA
eukprot:99475_1